jgi:DNA (cytosine-5)-methyltransferase 1
MLDAFCCAGAGADGYAEFFEIVGVDIEPQPNYPYRFVQADALAYLADCATYGHAFVFAHASPPCQHDSVASKSWNGRPAVHPDLIAPTRAALLKLDISFVIENVGGARHKLRNPMMLCGTMFPGLRVTRHRYFETFGFSFSAPPHGRHPLHYTLDKRKAHYGRLDEMRDFVSVNGGGNCTVAAARDAMGIQRPMTKRELNEAIPPAYTRYIGRSFQRLRTLAEMEAHER